MAATRDVAGRRYALAIMELPNVTSGNEEYGYLAAMLQLGAAIPWDRLGTKGEGSPSRRRNGSREAEGIGGSRRNAGDFRDGERPGF